MEHINTWIHNLLEENLISRVTFDTYDREIERYGGLQFIKHVEQIFDLDSIDAMNYFAETMQSKLNKVESIEQFALKLGFSIGMFVNEIQVERSIWISLTNDLEKARK